MAIFYAPTRDLDWASELVDSDVLKCLTSLPNSFHVFVEFHLPTEKKTSKQDSAQLDFLVVEVDRPLKVVVVEMKRVFKKVVDAPVNGPWMIEYGNGATTELNRGENPVQQLTRIADNLQAWLRKSFEAVLGRRPSGAVRDTVTVYRTLLFLSPLTTCHLQTPAFVRVVRTAEDLVADLQRLNPEKTVDVLDAAGAGRLAQRLSLFQKTKINGVTLTSASTSSAPPTSQPSFAPLLQRLDAIQTDLRRIATFLENNFKSSIEGSVTHKAVEATPSPSTPAPAEPPSTVTLTADTAPSPSRRTELVLLCVTALLEHGGFEGVVGEQQLAQTLHTDRTVDGVVRSYREFGFSRFSDVVETCTKLGVFTYVRDVAMRIRWKHASRFTGASAQGVRNTPIGILLLTAMSVDVLSGAPNQRVPIADLGKSLVQRLREAKLSDTYRDYGVKQFKELFTAFSSVGLLCSGAAGGYAALAPREPTAQPGTIEDSAFHDLPSRPWESA